MTLHVYDAAMSVRRWGSKGRFKLVRYRVIAEGPSEAKAKLRDMAANALLELDPNGEFVSFKKASSREGLE